MTTPSLSRLQTFHGHLGPKELLRVMIAEEFKDEIALFSSFGADSAVLVSMVAEIDPTIPVLFLDTQKHFSETLDYVETLTQHCGLKNLIRLTPDKAKLNRIDPKGDLWSFQPNRCCWLRKVEPLKRGVEEHGIKALITGRKRYQTADREEMQTIEIDEHDIFRINPLAGWTREDIEKEFTVRNLPHHPLVDQGYRSIGCQPCTQPVGEGQDERAGRWAHSVDLYGKQKAECGIHVPEAASWDV